MFDPRLCATSPIPVGVEILSRKTYLQETRSRRVAQLEHNINDDKNLWSGVVEGSKWIGVSAFHLSIAVTPLVMRTGKGRETGTGCSKPFVQPKRRPRDVSWSHLPSGTWGESETPQAHWNWDEHQRQGTTSECRVRNKLFSRNSCLNLQLSVHSAMKATVETSMTATRSTLTPLFDQSHCQRVGPLF